MNKTNENMLSETFSTLFNSREEADWILDYMRTTLKKLDITEAGDPRVAVTFPAQRKLHLDFCNWLILGFIKLANNQIQLTIALLETGVEDTETSLEITGLFTARNEHEEKVALVEMPLEVFQEDQTLQALYKKTLTHIENRFEGYAGSPYRGRSNKELLEQAVFYPEKRSHLLAENIEVTPEDDPQPVETYSEGPTISFNQELMINDLYFEDQERLSSQIKTALINNKHIILTGPPGTGKSKLAKAICDSFQVDYKMATATSDWSTYETIGGYRPSGDGTLFFNAGLFLDCFKDVETNHPTNKWLIIDEMNRADIDKAFGSFFSALTGDAITLDFQSEQGKSLMLRPQEDDEKIISNDYEYIIHKDWRLIGTMNTLDKTSLYEMSYAFMRRFAFIPVDVPENINQQLIDTLLEKWQIPNYPYAEDLVFIWKQINAYREIGPAIVEDITKYTNVDPDFTSALILYVLPQFEGLSDHDILEFIERMNELPMIEQTRLEKFARHFFHMKV